GNDAHGTCAATFFLIASACDWVMAPLLTWSSSVWPIAFWNAALTLLEVLPRFDAKCETKSLQAAEVLPFGWGAAAAFGAVARGDGVAAVGKPTLRPAAEAVIHTAPAATATAPVAIPSIRTWRRYGTRAMFLITAQLDRVTTLIFHTRTSRFCKRRHITRLRRWSRLLEPAGPANRRSSCTSARTRRCCRAPATSRSTRWSTRISPWAPSCTRSPRSRRWTWAPSCMRFGGFQAPSCAAAAC